MSVKIPYMLYKISDMLYILIGILDSLYANKISDMLYKISYIGYIFFTYKKITHLIK